MEIFGIHDRDEDGKRRNAACRNAKKSEPNANSNANANANPSIPIHHIPQVNPIQFNNSIPRPRRKLRIHIRIHRISNTILIHTPPPLPKHAIRIREIPTAIHSQKKWRHTLIHGHGAEIRRQQGCLTRLSADGARASTGFEIGVDEEDGARVGDLGALLAGVCVEGGAGGEGAVVVGAEDDGVGDEVCADGGDHGEGCVAAELAVGELVGEALFYGEGVGG